jgi:hypothetical protein
MSMQDAISAVTVLFIVGMIWLRTRMQYTGRARGPLQMQRAGKIYFSAALGVLVLGWLVAPMVGRTIWPDPNATPTLMRVVWFLATYYAFILVHRALKAKGVEVFKSVGGESV